jgi:6-pyruvoyl-tetrahydropterin synthase
MSHPPANPNLEQELMDALKQLDTNIKNHIDAQIKEQVDTAIAGLQQEIAELKKHLSPQNTSSMQTQGMPIASQSINNTYQKTSVHLERTDSYAKYKDHITSLGLKNLRIALDVIYTAVEKIEDDKRRTEYLIALLFLCSTPNIPDYLSTFFKNFKNFLQKINCSDIQFREDLKNQDNLKAFIITVVKENRSTEGLTYVDSLYHDLCQLRVQTRTNKK